ncbi:MAG: lipocalin family protein [Muribaculum sp.]|nr:lipocalin family protein [Muribaculum sp.]
MNKYVKNLMMVMVMTLAFAVLPSCSNDDDEPSGNSSIVGSWEFRMSIPGLSEDGIIRYTFDKNGSFEFYTRTFETEYDTATGSLNIVSVEEERQTGKWSVSGNNLTVEGYDEDGEYIKETTKFEIKGKELTIYIYESDGTTSPMTLTRV